MKQQFEEQVNLIKTLLNDASFEPKIHETVKIISGALRNGLPVLVCGNGGSAADALHISGELVGKFHQERKAQNVVCLNANVAVITAWANDKEYDSIFARQVEAHGKAGGICWGLTTSGNSATVIEAFKAAKGLGMKTIGFTGAGGGKLAKYSDILIDVPSKITPRIQELHLPIYHYICERVERLIA
jgi:D-sedoheptulose 7-phosphate isomerase